MKRGINSVVVEIQAFRHNEKNSSLGLRIQFQQFAHGLFNRHRLIGNGTASFPYYFKQENPVPAWPHRLWDPHSQYWLIASEFGLLGLFIFGSLLYTLFTASWRLKTLRVPALGILLPFIAGNFTDSLLFYSGSGYFFIIFMSLCLGEQLDVKNSNTHSKD
jgi:O-antigen ligase